MRISAERPYPVNCKLLLTFECQELGWTRVTSCVGSVVWAEPDSVDGGCTLGIKFSDGEDPGLTLLQ